MSFKLPTTTSNSNNQSLKYLDPLEIIYLATGTVTEWLMNRYYIILPRAVEPNSDTNCSGSIAVEPIRSNNLGETKIHHEPGELRTAMPDGYTSLGIQYTIKQGEIDDNHYILGAATNSARGGRGRGNRAAYGPGSWPWGWCGRRQLPASSRPPPRPTLLVSASGASALSGINVGENGGGGRRERFVGKAKT
jgi:hypothetical protein